MNKKNIEELEKLNPDLVIKLNGSANSPEWFEATANNQNFTIKSKNNKIFYAYNNKEPLKECKKIFKSVNLRSDCATILIGIGYGHLLYAMLKKAEKGHKIIVAENSLFLLKKSLDFYDFSEWLASGDLTITTNEADAKYFIQLLDSNVVIQDWGFVIEKYATLVNDYTDIWNMVLNLLNQIRCNTGTVMGAGIDLAKNDIANLPYVLKHKGVKVLEGIAKNKPAVLISTGPSLQKNIHLLRVCRDNVIIIAVAQALRYLLAYDIRPDFICTVDYGKTNMTHFEGLYDSGVNLVCLNRTYHEILEKWQGKKFIMASPVFSEEENVATLLNDKGCVDQGGSVAHSCLGLAKLLGCDPIIMIGQDLSLTNRSHMDNVDSGGKVRVDKAGAIQWYVDDPTSHLYGKEHSMGLAVHVDGYFGGQVLTNSGLNSFITAFETIIKNTKSKVINSTEGGANIKGLIKMSLDLALFLYCQNKIDKSLIDKIDDKETFDFDIEKMFGSDIDALNNIIDHCEKGLRTTVDMKKELRKRKKKSKENLKKLMRENEEHSNKAHELAKKNPLLTVAIYKESRMIHNKDLNVEGKTKHLLKNKDDFLTRISRNEMILKAAKEQSEMLLELYQQTLNKLQHGGEVTPSMHKKVTAKEIEEKFKNGNWAACLIEARNKNIDFDIIEHTIDTAISMREEEYKKAVEKYNSENIDNKIIALGLLEAAKEEGKNNNFKISYEYIKAAHFLHPENQTIRWGYATALYHIGEEAKSLEFFEELLVDYPDNLRFRFEYALILINTNAEKAMQIFIDVMNKTDQFNYFYASIAQYYETQHKYEEAIQAYQFYLDCFPAAEKEILERIQNLQSLQLRS